MDAGVPFQVPYGVGLYSLTLPLDFGTPFVPSPEVDMIAACGTRMGQKVPHAGGPLIPSPPQAPQALPPLPTWRPLPLNAAGLTWTLQGASEQSSCWQHLSSQFPGLIGSREGAGSAGPGRRPESWGGRGVSHACPPGPVWTRPSTFPLLSATGQAASAHGIRRRPSDSQARCAPQEPACSLPLLF